MFGDHSFAAAQSLRRIADTLADMNGRLGGGEARVIDPVNDPFGELVLRSPAEERVKLCKDCEHFAASFIGCRRPISKARSIVTGDYLNRLDVPAANERRADRRFWTRALRCGPLGRFWRRRAPALRRD